MDSTISRASPHQPGVHLDLRRAAGSIRGLAGEASADELDRAITDQFDLELVEARLAHVVAQAQATLWNGVRHLARQIYIAVSPDSGGAAYGDRADAGMTLWRELPAAFAAFRKSLSPTASDQAVRDWSVQMTHTWLTMQEKERTFEAVPDVPPLQGQPPRVLDATDPESVGMTIRLAMYLAGSKGYAMERAG